MNDMLRSAALFAAVPVLSALPASAAERAPLAAQANARPAVVVRSPKIGLGAVLSTADGGDIFGFDIDRFGSDGILASAKTIDGQGDMSVSVERFDENTGAVVASFAHATGKRDSYGVDGIVAGDVALVTHYITPPHKLGAFRKYETVAPVTADRFTGAWTPPLKDNFDVLQSAGDQVTPDVLLFGIELANQDKPDLIVSDIAKNTVANVIPLDPNLFGGGNGPQLGRYTKANEGVIALSPDGGRVGGAPPLNVLVDLATGKQRRFNGLNLGPFHSGFVNGLAVDPNTGIAATTTELNAQVEFYDLNKESGFAVQLPCTGPASQSNSGAGIAVDAVHKLFLVTDPFYCNGNQGSALVIYDERGNLVETITGFKFFIGEGAPALNETKRMGWALGPSLTQLQQFFY